MLTSSASDGSSVAGESRASRSARVAIVTTSFPRGEGDASGHFVLSHARALAQNGEHVTVLAEVEKVKKGVDGIL